MNQLYPIIRRARRPLLPPDEPQQRVVIPVTVEPGPVETVPLVVAPVEPSPVEAVVEASPAAVPEPSAPPARRPRKERKNAQAPAT
jgi:hypothetical protein